MLIVMVLGVPRKPGEVGLMKVRRVVAHTSSSSDGPNFIAVMSASNLNPLWVLSSSALERA